MSKIDILLPRLIFKVFWFFVFVCIANLNIFASKLQMKFVVIIAQQLIIPITLKFHRMPLTVLLWILEKRCQKKKDKVKDLKEQKLNLKKESI